MNGKCSENKNVEVLVDQIGQNFKKWIVSTQNESHTLFIMNQLILMKRGKGNIVGRVFINYGEFHDNYQHS